MSENYAKYEDIFQTIKQVSEDIEDGRRRLDKCEQSNQTLKSQIKELFKTTMPPLVRCEINDDAKTIWFYFLPPMVDTNAKYESVEQTLDLSLFQELLGSKMLKLDFCLFIIASTDFQAMVIYYDEGLLKDYAKRETQEAKIELWRDEVWEEIKSVFILDGYMEPVLQTVGENNEV